jgi:hypothetical protein
VTIQWNKSKITDPLALELRQPALGGCSDSSSREAGSTEIQIGDGFSYNQARFEIQEFIGD